MKEARDYTINSVKRALDILKLFNEQRTELTLSEISDLSGIGKSSILRFLYTLRNDEFIAYDEETKKYSLGIEMYRLGMSKFNSLDLRKISRKWLQNLSDETNMICYLAVREGDAIVFLEQVIPTTVPAWTQLLLQSGSNSELYSTGIGRLFLAQEDDKTVEEYLDRCQFQKFTNTTVTDKLTLMELVRQAREGNFSGNIGENEDYIYSLCAPVYGRDGKMIAGVSLCGLQDAICSSYDYYINKIKSVAEQISHDLGYVPK